jgi:outer membrane protein OmpA-like peptidoglycan-associated protein
MSGTFLKWGIPAFLTVVGGTAAAVLTSGAAIPTDLTGRAHARLAGPDYAWASVSFDAQDATLSGTATTQQMIDDATAKLAEIHGVRSVTSNVVLAEYVSPFPFVASVANGKLTLAGGLPDEAARAEVLASAGEGVTDSLRLMSGAPDRATWIAAARYAVDQARGMDEGEVALADLNMTLSGRAGSGVQYEELTNPAAPPAGVKVGFSDVQPPVAAPFEWHAQFDGKRLNLSGVTPSDELVAELSAMAPAGVEVSTSMVLASGAPSGFDDNAKLLLKNLLTLESGDATISDAALTLDGSPADQATADTVRVAMTSSGANVTLGAPRITDYWLTADRAASGIVLDGFVPDAATRDRLEAMDKVDASGLELGRGAPDRFESAVDFVIDALGRMSEGHAEVKGTVITIDGRAATLPDYAAVQTSLQLGAPQGLILGATTIKPPMAKPFTFTATKSADGAYALSGYVPSDAAHQALVDALPEGAADKLVLADGNPEGFEVQAGEALDVLALLDSGQINYDGNVWSISGAVDAPAKALAAEQAFTSAGLRQAGWSYDVALPKPAVQAALPIIDPYAWRVQKSADGTLLVSGFAPTEQFKRYVAIHADSKVVDSSSVGAGAPEHFVRDAIAGLDALMGMQQGAISLAAGSWTLTGNVDNDAERHAIETRLTAAADTSAWHVAIQAANAAPVVSPFTWSASRSADGSVALAGYVPTDEMRKAVAAKAGTVATDSTLVGSGEPDGFATDVMAGLDALSKLTSGQVAYDGQAWSIAGQPATAPDAEAAKAALNSAADGAAGWKVALAEPAQATPVEPAATEPVVETPAADTPADEETAPVAEESAPVEPAVAEAAPEAVTAPPADAVAPEAPAEADAPAQVAEVAPQPETPKAPVVRNYVFEAKKAIDAPVSLVGSVPADAMRRFLAVVTDTEPNDALQIDANLPADFIPNAEAGARALMLLADGEFGLDGGKWVLTGRAETEAGKQAALTALAAVPALDQWETDVTLLPPLLICEQKVGAFQTRNAILFESGSARIAETSDAAIDELAGYLALCPEATVNVEGHTDADGDADANLALSVSRAEAVVDALIGRGVSPDRLYAVGYGESLPVASNDTRAGKQANRRIAFTLADE